MGEYYIMSETSEKIARLLEDPESIKMITEIAESFINNGESDDKEPVIESESKQNSDAVSISANHIPGEFSALVGSLEKKISPKDIDKTVHLIMALQPFLSNRRSHSADTVIKYLGVLKSISGENLSKLTSVLGLLNK